MGIQNTYVRHVRELVQENLGRLELPDVGLRAPLLRRAKGFTASSGVSVSFCTLPGMTLNGCCDRARY